MQIPLPPVLRNKQGYALLVTMTFMAIMLVLFAAMMFNTLSNANTTKRNNQYNASQAAAQAATEKVLSQMTHDFEFNSLSNSGSYYGKGFIPSQAGEEADWPVKYVFSDTNGVTNQISVNMAAWSSTTTPLNSQFSGLYGLEQNCTLTATATPLTGSSVPATIGETVQFALIPLFQFAIFYNMNLEMAAGGTLNVYGAVYSNGGIWSGTTDETFYNTVSSVGLATNAANDPFCVGYSDTGPATYKMSGQPSSGNDTLTMPIGTNNNPASVEAIVNIPPSTYGWGTAAAYSTNGQLYLANAADLFVTNSASGTNWGSATLAPGSNSNFTVYYQDGAESPNYEMWVTNDFYILKTTGTFTNYVSSTSGVDCITNVRYAGYSFLTNVLFYDAREGYHAGSGPAKTVQAVQIDLVKFNTWLNNTNVNGGAYYNSLCNLSNHKSHSIDCVYIYNGVPLTSSTLPAVRVVHGGMMPPADGSSGFTLATAQPLYVWGDYNASNTLGSSISQNNTVYTEPAALMADAITILSDGWSDGTGSQFTGGPTASTTTINAACLEGIVESNTNNAASDDKGYSGGVENFLRLLENWGSKDLYYNGSIVVMFPSQYATNCWQSPGNPGYYGAPTREWAFDTNFNNAADLPPLTPKSQGVIRGTWTVN